MVSYLSKLGKLSFTDEELKKTAEEMTSIIEIMDTIKEIDVEYNALADNKNPQGLQFMIYDIVISDQAEIDLRGIFGYIAFELQAPEKERNMFKIPKVIQ